MNTKATITLNDALASGNVTPASNPELTTAMRIIEAGLARGYTASVFDSEEWAVKRSTDATVLRAALQSTDQDTIRFRTADGAKVGVVAFIWGNGAGCVAADWTDNDAINAILKDAGYQD